MGRATSKWGLQSMQVLIQRMFGVGDVGWGGGGVVRARAQSNPSLTQYFIFHEKFWISLINLGYSIYP